MASLDDTDCRPLHANEFAPSLPASALQVLDAERGRVVAFLGSGVSLFAPTSLPSWWGFINQVIASIGGAAGDAGVAHVSHLHALLSSGALPPYAVTNVFARRLGASYLEVMRCFLDVEPNAIHRYFAHALLHGDVSAVVTTNFDRAIETAFAQAGGAVVTLTGEWEADRAALDACPVSDGSRRPLVTVPTFESFRTLSRIPTLLNTGTHAFMVKIHGDAGFPRSCIDTEFQRAQGLPSFVQDVLSLLLQQRSFVFMAFGGGDLDKDLDYIRLRAEGDLAKVYWMLREGEAEPAKLFDRMRELLRDRFVLLRGSFAGEIRPGGNPALAARMSEWASRMVGPFWASLVLLDLCIAADLHIPETAALRDTCMPAAGDSFSPNAAIAYAAAHSDDVISLASVRQLRVAAPLQNACEALSDGQPMQALQHSVSAVMAQREHFADSRLLPDAWMASAVLAASLWSLGLDAEAADVGASAAAIATLVGNGHAADALRQVLEALPTRRMVESEDQGLLHLAMEDELHVFLPAFDNVGGFSQGAPVATMLRAHLHRGMLVADAIAIGPQFLLNCRPFVSEVLRGSGERDGLPVMHESYLHALRPMLPREQTVQGRDGVTRVIRLHDDVHALATFRRECQLNNKVFLAETIDEALISAISRFYEAHPHYILWYDVRSVANAYGQRTKCIFQHADTAATALRTPMDGEALRAAAPQALQFVQASLDTSGLTRSLVYRFADLFKVSASADQFKDACKQQLDSLAARRSERAVHDLVESRNALVQRPWRFGPPLRDVADASYNTALPLGVGLSMLTDAADDLQLRLVRIALEHEEDCTRVLDAVVACGADAGVRVTELAALPLPALARLRAASLPLRRSVRALRRVLQRRNHGSPAATPVLARSVSGSDGPRHHTSPVLVRASSQNGPPLSGDESWLVSRLQRAADDLYTELRRELVPVDMYALPSLRLDAIRVREVTGSNDVGSAILHLVQRFGSLSVCKGEPLPPTFTIPMLRFPGLMVVAKPELHRAPTSHGPSATTTEASREITCEERILAYHEPANKWVRVWFDRVRFPSGKSGRYNIVEEFGGSGQLGVVVMPLTRDGRIVLIHQHRYPVSSWSWEIPRGCPEPGRTPEQQALAELAEETGLELDGEEGRIVPLHASSAGGTHPVPIWVNNGICNTGVTYFAAVNLRQRAGGATPEDGEAIQHVRALTLQRVVEMIEDGEIQDSFTIIAFGLALVRGIVRL